MSKRHFFLWSSSLLIAFAFFFISENRLYAQEGLICTQEYAPVCGVNGITYSNKCLAAKMPVAYEGTCEGKEFNPETQPFSLKLEWGYFRKPDEALESNFGGNIDITGNGKVFLNKSILFENSDSILARSEKDFSRLEWNSLIDKDSDGVIVNIYPTELSQEIKIRVGDFSKTYTMKELKTISNLQTIDDNGHQVSLKSLGVIPLSPILLEMKWGRLPKLSPERSVVTNKWVGKITFSNAKAQVVRTILFDGKDTISPAPQGTCSFNPTGSGSIVTGCLESESINFETYSTNHFDGALVFVPNDTASMTLSITHEVTTSGVKNTFEKKYLIDEIRAFNMIKTMDDQGNGIMIKNIGNSPYEILYNMYDRKQELLAKLTIWEDTIDQLIRGKFGIDVTAIRTTLQKLKEYRLPKELYENMETNLKPLMERVQNSNLNSQEIRKIIDDFNASIEQILERSRNIKFEQGLIPFKDTDDDEWYYDSVSSMKKKNIISGYKDEMGNFLGLFVPANNVTFAESFKIILNGADKGENSNLYENENVLSQAVDSSWEKHWAVRFLQIAKYLNLRVLKDDNFNLNLPITRGQLVSVITDVFALDTTQAPVLCFVDLNDGHKYAKDICKLKMLGIVSGNPDGTFKADQAINRAEMSKIIDKTLTFFGKN